MHAGDPNSNWAFFQEQKEVHVNLRLRMSGSEMTDWNEPGTALVSATICCMHVCLSVFTCLPIRPTASCTVRKHRIRICCAVAWVFCSRFGRKK